MVNLLTESFEVHDTLNPKIWTSKNVLIPEVRDSIIKIVKEFRSNIELPDISIVDIHILGSNASFNYTENSDLDVHVVVNFEMMDASKEIIQTMYNAEKQLFNKDYQISIHGINVELYVEDIKSTTISNGIYSVYSNQWIKFPNRLDEVPEVDLEPELSNIKGQIHSSILGNTIYTVEDWINSLYLIRKNSLDTEGEYGKGNLIFKAIRNDGLLDELKAKRLELKSKMLSIESVIRDFYKDKTTKVLNESTIFDDSPFYTKVASEEDCGDYILKVELTRMKDDDPGSEVEMRSCYSKIDGSYIGNEEAAKLFIDKGICPQSYNPDKCGVSAIGFCDKEQKWYGWSHRAMYGFGIGDKVDCEDHLCADYLPVGFECEDLDDCKLCAIAYAKAVD